MDTDDRRRRLSAPFRPRNYRALWHTLTTYRRPVDALGRYVRGSGDYPWRTTLRTPTGAVSLLVPHPHDVRTVNEVFCRRDYGSGSPRVVVDIGGNIGVSAAYFLSRRRDTRVHVWEPVTNNLEVLRANVGPFGDRCVVHEAAVAPLAGAATFLLEPVGRYCGLADYLPSAEGRTAVEVWCDAAADALREVVEREGFVDLLKIDTEGSEQAIVDAIPAELREHIGTVVYEVPGRIRHLTWSASRAHARRG